MTGLNYILITPVLNEARHLPKLRDTVAGQTVKPIVWVIGDGGSTDKSFEIATEIFKEYGWVHVIRQCHFSEEGYSHKNFANNVNDCLEYAKKVCADGKIDYAFVGKTDATPALSCDYFEKLLSAMARNPKIAFACGSQYMQRAAPGEGADQKSSWKVVNGFNDIRLYRREFIEGMGGYPVSFAPDTVLMIKALNRGWEVNKVEKAYFVKTRLNGSKIGFWNGYRQKGAGMYQLGYHPVLIFLSALLFTRTYPFYLGVAVLYGYVMAFARNEGKINDGEVIQYFWKERLVQVCKGKISEGKK